VTKKFFIETFGCQMNHHDSEKVAGTLAQMGYAPTDQASDADLLLINTCNIREKANQKVLSRLGALHKTYGAKRTAKVGLLGCMAQMEGVKVFEKSPDVDLVAGSNSYSLLPELIQRVEEGEKRVIDISQDADRLFETYTQNRENPYKAFVTIMEGCDKFCSFCVVPYTRGRERSRPSQHILQEIGRLALEGYQEVMLLGQTVSSWRDPESEVSSFTELLKRIANIDGIRRVRFISPHPRDFHSGLVEVIENYPEICNQVHLPLQSGSTEVLRRMKRDYTSEEFLSKVKIIQRSRREIAISTDIIVGFPGETQQDFEQTLSLMEQARFESVYSFKYSPRPGTEAFEFEDAVPEEEKSRRLQVLQEFQRKIQLTQNERLLGKTFEILVDGKSQRPPAAGTKANPGDVGLMGRTTQNKIANFTGPERLLGQFIRIRITSFGPNSLTGELEP
jgi:tRNA-2-methylthio-N6-dimethylallyladenosine synthase